MENRASPRRRRRRPKLLSAETKRVFFSDLDAFLASDRRVDARLAGENSTRGVMTNKPTMDGDVPMGRGAGLRVVEQHAVPQSPPSGTMVRTLPTAAASGTKRRASMPPADKPKRGKTRATKSLDALDASSLVLHGRRVLLVPIGSDVSRKRLEIWADMVVALGGTVVPEPGNTAVQKTHKQHAQLLHLHGSAQVDKDVGKSDENAFDWARVDIVVVSAQVDATRLQQHYRLGSEGLPSQLKLVTPEWLVHVRQEKQLPKDDTLFGWRHEVARIQQEREQEHEQKDVVRNGTQDGDESADESEDGSDRKNLTTREIVRAPPVRIDMDKIRREEEEMQKKKAKLVSERIPIFHQLNPRFETIANAGEGQGQKLKMEAFVCQKSSVMQANLNAHLTDPLEELMEFLHVERDIWREYSYKKIVSSLKAMRTRVSSVRDLKGLWWAKGRMRDKVVEVLETGKLEKLEAKKSNLRLRTLVEMSRIWGVGPATAAKLYNMGYKTMDALRENGDSVLSSQQQIGLKHYEDFMTKIPRSEVQEIEKTVVDEVHRLIPNATALACGSYRRGKTSSGDVDVLITDPDSEECDILPELLKRLHATGFLTDDLTHVSDHHMGQCDSYMGVCRLRDGLPFRRLDIKVYPRRYFGFALLYFTGSDHFNRSMRLFARKKGWSLSDRYLKRVVRVRKGVKLEAGESVVCPEEVDVFIALGLEYKDPTERNCFDIRFLEEDEALAKTRKSARTEDADAVADEL